MRFVIGHKIFTQIIPMQCHDPFLPYPSQLIIYAIIRRIKVTTVRAADSVIKQALRGLLLTPGHRNPEQLHSASPTALRFLTDIAARSKVDVIGGAKVMRFEAGTLINAFSDHTARVMEVCRIILKLILKK